MIWTKMWANAFDAVDHKNEIDRFVTFTGLTNNPVQVLHRMCAPLVGHAVDRFGLPVSVQIIHHVRAPGAMMRMMDGTKGLMNAGH
jgi:hypothetical protein